jgi:hypothetical protein
VLRRKRATQKVAKLRHGKNRQRLLDISRQLARWAEDDGDALSDDPEIPDELNDRQADFSAVLLAIADQAGADWPLESRSALVSLLAEGADRAEDYAIRLLHDLRTIFDADLTQRMGLPPDKQEIESKQLVDQLLGMAESPWASPESGRPLTQHKLARMLRDFGIAPGMIGPEKRRRKGYRRLWFEEAWAAYPEAPTSVLPASPLNRTSQTSHSGGNQPFSDDLQTSQEGSAVSFDDSQKPAEFRRDVRSVSSDSGSPRENTEEGSHAPSTIPAARNHSGKDFSLQKAAESAANPGATLPERGNGGTRARPTDIVAELIRQIAAGHPDWDEDRLSKQCGQPIAVVKRALADRPRPRGGDNARAR